MKYAVFTFGCLAAVVASAQTGHELYRSPVRAPDLARSTDLRGAQSSPPPQITPHHSFDGEQTLAEELAAQLQHTVNTAAKVEDDVNGVRSRAVRLEKLLRVRQHEADQLKKMQLKALRAGAIQRKAILAERRRADRLQAKAKDLENDLGIRKRVGMDVAKQEVKIDERIHPAVFHKVQRLTMQHQDEEGVLRRSPRKPARLSQKPSSTTSYVGADVNKDVRTTMERMHAELQQAAAEERELRDAIHKELGVADEKKAQRSLRKKDKRAMSNSSKLAMVRTKSGVGSGHLVKEVSMAALAGQQLTDLHEELDQLERDKRESNGD